MRLPTAALALLFSAPAAAEPTRIVEGSRLVSDADPALSITVPEAATYLGGTRIAIADWADAEIHAFAEADAHGLIERFYWIQFERIREAVPDARYDYRETNPETVEIDGFAMHMRPFGGNTRTETVEPGSDYAAFRALVDAAGLRLPEWTTMLRLAHLHTADARAELLVIYGEGPGPLAAAAEAAMRAGAEGVFFADLLPALVADADARIDLAPLPQE